MDKMLVDYKSSTPSEESCEGVLLSPQFIANHWKDMQKQLSLVPHIWRHHCTLESMFESLMTGHWTAWGFGPPGVIRVTVFSTIVGYPIGTILQLLIVFGNSIDTLLPVMEATFERVAQVNGCVGCEIYGRPGWERKLKNFRRVAVVLRREAKKEGVH